MAHYRIVSTPTTRTTVALGQTFCRRAWRHARKGDYRKAVLALRELAAITGQAKNWVRLGDMLLRAQRNEEALDALRQAMWLHRRIGSEGRARTVARMILRVDPKDALATRFFA